MQGLDQQPPEHLIGVLGQYLWMQFHQLLQRPVDRIAPEARLHWLVWTIQPVQLQHVAGVDGVRVPHPGLHPRDRQGGGAGLDRRPGPRSGRRVEIPGGVERRGPVQQFRPTWQGQPRAPGEGAKPPEPARLHSRRPLEALAVQQHHVRRAGGLGKVVSRQADPPLRRGQAERRTHRPRQERIGLGGPGPHALLQPRQDQPIGVDQARLDGAKDLQAGMRAAGSAHRLALHQPSEQVGEVARRHLRQPLALLDQCAQQGGGRLPLRPGP